MHIYKSKTYKAELPSIGGCARKYQVVSINKVNTWMVDLQTQIN
jgi:hypothetical protein